MAWIAIGATVDNIVITVNDDIILVEEAADYDFDVIVKIYQVSDDEYKSLKNGNLSWRIRFKSLRETYLEPIVKSQNQLELTGAYARRINQLINVRGRFEHALNKHKPMLSQQLTIYEAKVLEAKEIVSDPSSKYVDDGFVKDYAEEKKLDIRTAATLIITKHENWYEHLRKIERLRLRHLTAIKKAKTSAEFAKVAADIDKDFFINMLL